MPRLREERGMTLPEVLVSLTIALIISLATFALIDTTMRRTGDIAARVDATQRGRQTMDFITRQLRSQVCVQASAPAMLDDRAFYAVTPTSVTFFSDLSDESVKTGNTPQNPELRQLAFEDGRLIERRWTGTAGGTALTPTYSYGYPGTPTQTRLLSADISPVDTLADGSPQIFRFYYYRDADNDSTTAPVMTEYPAASLATLTPAQLTVLTKVAVTFRSNPPRGKATGRGRVVMQNEVYSRLADPNNLLNPSPVCV
jgi:prepilin-type N-terminal cleavage/methylation domain-containing protein